MQKRSLLGMLTPSSNTVLEPVTAAILAGVPDVTAHFGRFRVTEISMNQRALGQFQNEPILQAAELLAEAKVGVISWNGTSSGWLGFDADEKLCQAIQERTGIPANTSVLALNEIFKLTGVTRFGLVTPYLDEIQEKIIANYGRAGFTCVGERHLKDRGNFSFSEYTEEKIKQLIREVAASKPQAITVFCTNMRGAPGGRRDGGGNRHPGLRHGRHLDLEVDENGRRRSQADQGLGGACSPTSADVSGKEAAMESFDLVIRNGTVATAADVVACDIGVRDGRIVALGESLARGRDELDARGRLVLPGGIDSHCHFDQPTGDASVMADDFRSGTLSAACGGTTTVIPFACQARGQSLRAAVEDYHKRAAGKAAIDYAFHLIVTDPTEQVLGQELPALIADGYTSFKIYMTYDALKLSDRQMLDVLDLARRHGAMAMVHAENSDCIAWLTERLELQGKTGPYFHAESRPQAVERGGHPPGDRSRRTGRDPRPHRSCLGARRDRADSLGAEPRAASLRRNLPALPAADGPPISTFRVSKARSASAARRRARRKTRRRCGKP